METRRNYPLKHTGTSSLFVYVYILRIVIMCKSNNIRVGKASPHADVLLPDGKVLIKQ